MAYGNKYSFLKYEYKYKYKYFKLVLEHNSSTSTSIKYYTSGYKTVAASGLTPWIPRTVYRYF